MVVTVRVCLLWMRYGTEMRMLEKQKYISEGRRTMAIYNLNGHWKIEGSLRKWLVRCLDLVSEDSQCPGQRRDTKMLLTSTGMSSVLFRPTNNEISRENRDAIVLYSGAPAHSRQIGFRRRNTGLEYVSRLYTFRKPYLRVSKVGSRDWSKHWNSKIFGWPQ